jgi:hypothetical protein
MGISIDIHRILELISISSTKLTYIHAYGNECKIKVANSKGVNTDEISFNFSDSEVSIMGAIRVAIINSEK